MKELHPNIKWRLFIGFFTIIIHMMIHPFLVLYFNDKVGMRVTGFIYILVIITAMLGSLISGFISDKIGRKKVMIISELMMGVTYFFIALLNSPWIDRPYVSAMFVIINHFFAGAFSPVSMALLLDSSTLSNREFIFKLNYWLNTIGIAIGGLIGGIFFLKHVFLFFSIEACFSFISLVITIFFVTDEYNPKILVSNKEKIFWKKHMSQIIQSYVEVGRDIIFMLLIAGSVLLFSIEHQLTNFIGIRLSDEFTKRLIEGLIIDGPMMLGILKFENTLLIILGTFFVSSIMKGLEERVRLLLGVLLFSLGYFILTIQQDFWGLILAMMVGTIGQIIYIPVKQVILGYLAKEHLRSSYMAIHQISTYFGEIIAGFFLIFGSLLTNTMAAFIFLLFGFSSVIMFSFMTKMMSEKKVFTNSITKKLH